MKPTTEELVKRSRDLARAHISLGYSSVADVLVDVADRMEEQQDRIVELEKIARLADELTAAVDANAEDVGGHRKELTILRDMGLLVEKVLYPSKTAKEADNG